MEVIEKPYICEMCGKKLAEKMGIVLPQDMIARVELEEEMVEDPTCLRYCSKRCQRRWHALKRGTIWDQHGQGCMCAACYT
jgi:hypothetical protein